MRFDELCRVLPGYAVNNEKVFGHNVFYLTIPGSSSKEYLSFAWLNDQEGDRYNVQYEGTLTYEFVKDIVTLFCDTTVEDEDFVTPATFAVLESDKYFIQFYAKYYHFVMALNFAQFELESKGVAGGVFAWYTPSYEGVELYTDHQIRDTGDHMWSDGNQISCNSLSCDHCHPYEYNNSDSDEQ